MFGVGSAAPSTGLPDTGRRTTGGGGVGAGGTVAADLERPQEVAARRRVAVRDAGAAGVDGEVLLAVDLVA